MTQLAGVDMLGYTYDVLGKYADIDSTQLPVIDILTGSEDQIFNYDNLEDAAYTYPSTCTVQSSSPQTASFETHGSSYSEFSRTTSSRLGLNGDFGAYSGSIDISYNESVKASSQYYYSSIFDTASGYVLRINSENLKLKDEVQTQLDAVDSAEAASAFFASVGTHVVAGVLVGGQCRYWSYGSKENWESSSEFSVSAEAAYSGASGSGSYSTSTSTKTEDVRTDVGVEVLGGTTVARSGVVTDQDFTGWAASIPYQPAVVGFMAETGATAGLVPIWDFCTNPEAQTLLECQFEIDYVPQRSDTTWVDIQGDTSDYSAGDYIQLATNDPDEFIVGFGGNVNDNNNLNRMGIMIENVRTGERYWEQNEDGNLERSLEVPEGCALTGVAIHAKDNHLKNLKAYYQLVNRGDNPSNGGAAVDSEVFHLYDGGENESWDLDSDTKDYNKKALGGLRVRVHNGKGKLLSQAESTFEVAGAQD